jgi:hypothetical protein
MELLGQLEDVCLYGFTWFWGLTGFSPAVFTPPWGEDFVLGRGGDGGFGAGEEFAAEEPSYGRLCGALGDADGFG